MPTETTQAAPLFEVAKLDKKSLSVTTVSDSSDCNTSSSTLSDEETFDKGKLIRDVGDSFTLSVRSDGTAKASPEDWGYPGYLDQSQYVVYVSPSVVQ